MPQGLQVWDGSGNIILDTNTRTVRIHGTLTTTSNQSGSVTIDTSQGTPFYQVMSYIQNNYNRPLFSFSGNTLSWTAAPYTSFVMWGTF